MPQIAETTLEAGQVIAGQFTVRQVFTGGFSEVAIVENPNQTLEALKIIKRDRLENTADLDAVRRQFQQECHVWRDKLRGCPYIAQPNFSFLSFEGLGPALFMDYVDGPSLARLRPDGGRLSISQTIRVGRQIAEAMAFAHAKEILHRDLKPSNVLLTRKNEVRLIDWGLTSVQEAAGFEGYSPGYASPQREANSALADKKDDVFSFSVILYECLTGKLPNARDGEAEIRARLVKAEPMLPAALLDLIARGLGIDPAMRSPFIQILAVLSDQDLIRDVARREVERPFCPGCKLVSIQATHRCPVCDSPCRQRIPRPVREGMARIPAGAFTKGLSQEQAQQAWLATGQRRPTAEQIEQLASEPPSQVFLPQFDIDVHPVTNADFEEFCKQTHYPEPEGFAANKVAFPRHPVVDVTWKDALCYALWQGKRLPTPLEWEKAARGDRDNRSYPWGDLWQPDRCNNNRTPSAIRTTEVDQLTVGARDGRSPFGVADMVGNVREWLSEGKQYGMRGLRGGSWTDPCIIEGLVSFQIDAEVDFHDKATGFRCAADVAYDETEISQIDREKGARHA